MAKKRRLSDLYVRGRQVTFDDGAGEPITVYLQKLNPVESETAMRRANAARARVLASARGGDADDYDVALGEVLDYEDDAVIEALAAEDVLKKAPALEAELEAEDEWSKENYLQGLRDAWIDGARDAYAADPEDGDAKRVFAELKRFSELLEERIDGERERVARDLGAQPMEVLRSRLLDRLLQHRADQAWLAEFRRAELFFAVREDNAEHARYFEDRAEVDELSLEVLTTLLREYEELTVDVIEGKGSPATPDSSTSPDSPETATEASSGQPAAAA